MLREDVSGGAVSGAHRTDVDGLRAVAIVPVVLYHLGLGCTGGYVGVDVFFVISGFLIGSQILRAGPSFSFVGFWERRVRRIFPAAFVMTATTFVWSWVVLLPEDFAKLGESMVAQATTLSNLYFYRDIDYFVADAARPLLHTWSLAVEEQFYVFIPVVIVMLSRRSRVAVGWGLAAISLLSFALAERTVFRNPSLAFYLLPYRAWEMLLGVCIALVPSRCIRSRWPAETLAATGLAAIACAVFSYDRSTRFPAHGALLPCLGAALIILAGGHVTRVHRLLSTPLLNGIGLLSYSIYLWHWPIITFAEYGAPTLTSDRKFVLLVVILVTAAISWYVVESPVRKRAVLATRGRAFGAAGIASLALAVAGLVVFRAAGVPRRWPSEALRFAQQRHDTGHRPELTLAGVRAGELFALTPSPGIGGGVTDPLDLIVWGDSHAMAILYAVEQTCRARGWRCSAITHSSTAPVVQREESSHYSLRQDAPAFADAVVGQVGRLHAKNVLLAAYWSAYGPPGVLRAQLLKTFDALAHTGTRVYVLEDVQAPGFDVPTALAVATANGTPFAVYEPRHEPPAVAELEMRTMLRTLGRPDVTLLDPIPYLVTRNGTVALEADGRVLYFDAHHLSPHGSLRLTPLFERITSGG